MYLSDLKLSWLIQHNRSNYKLNVESNSWLHLPYDKKKKKKCLSLNQLDPKMKTKWESLKGATPHWVTWNFLLFMTSLFSFWFAVTIYESLNYHLPRFHFLFLLLHE